jgi:hypothetical protein
MEMKISSVIVFALVCGWATIASAEDKAATGSSAVSIATMTKEKFEAIAPNATIEINGERLTKSEFIARRQSAIDQAVKQLQGARTRAETGFAAHREAILAGETAKLEEDNKKVQAEVARLVAADAAAPKEPTGTSAKRP